jgi:hypothetical protein
MYHDPGIPTAYVVVVSIEAPKLQLWLDALRRPEAESKCKAADAIALAQQRMVARVSVALPEVLAANIWGLLASPLGKGPLLAALGRYPGRGLEVCIGPLREELDRPEQNPAARLAAARALIVLEARMAAPSLWRQAQASSGELRELVEPVLARWHYAPARLVWRQRLREPTVSQRDLILAIRGLAALGDTWAADRLRGLALSGTVPVTIRLEAADALAILRPSGLEKDARSLVGDRSARGLPARLVAAALLRRHESEAAVGLLQDLARDPEPAVAARAAARLLEFDSDKLLPALKHLLGSSDARLRWFGVDVLYRKPTAPHIRLLGDRLDDPHLDVRRQARKRLVELGDKKDHRDAVIGEGRRMVETDQWRGLEQATILLTQLEHRLTGEERRWSARRFVELLSFKRPEVYITAAWGLRRLAVKETLDPVLKFVDTKEKEARAAIGNRTYPFIPLDHQLSQLNQFLGQQRYLKADEEMRAFIPRFEPPMQTPVCLEARAAAIWALGLFHPNKKIPQIATALIGRFNDRSMPPEDGRILLMGAITLGRMKMEISELRRHCPDGQLNEDAITNACCWALSQIEGKPIGKQDAIRRIPLDWFLRPNPPRKK